MRKFLSSALSALLLCGALMSGCSAAPAAAQALPLTSPSLPQGEADRFAPQPEEAFRSSLNAFTVTSSGAVLGALSEAENGVYSPVSLYLALALCTSGAQGATRQELLGALQAGSMDAAALAEGAKTLFTSLYSTGEYGHRKLGASLWLAKGLTFEKAFLQTAADAFFADVYETDFSSEGATKAISDWLASHCGGKKGVAAPPAVDADTLMALYTAIDFQDEWISCFSEKATAPAAFTRADGSSVTCDFLNKGDSGSFLRGTGYTAASLSCKERSTMTFYLPDEGKTPAGLLSDPAVLSELLSGDVPEDGQGYGTITWSIPKFDVKSDLSLSDALKSLGVRRAFSSEEAEFSGMTGDASLFLSSARQAARVAVDEKGVTASAYTELAYAGAGMPLDHADMILNRPFLFSISSGGTVLFVGVVNDPAA